ncbi:Rv1157c family protein [Gordonia sp. NPDC003424]
MRLSALQSLRAAHPKNPAGIGRRAVLAAVGITAAASLGLPAVAQAAPAPAPAAPLSSTSLPEIGKMKVDQHTLDSLGAFAPAIIGAVTTKGADGKINPQLIAQARALASAPGMPPQVAQTWQKIIDFLGEPGRNEMLRQQKAAERKPGEPEIPTGPNAPKIQEFLYPTLGIGCMPPEKPGGMMGNSLGRALVTAGPQAAPAPGPKRGEAGYVYTALGTGPAFNSRTHPLWVSWINIDTGQTGQFALKRNPKINAVDGPGTFTGIAKTGKGRVVSTIYGNVTTVMDKHVISCGIVPVIGLAIV